MEKLKAKLKKQGGFTLIEMLIVVAIIAILIAVSIPVVNNALDRARHATDGANERAAKAELLINYLSGDDASTPITADGNTVYAYDAQNGTLVEAGGGTGTEPAGYSKCTQHGHTANTMFVVMTINEDGEVTMGWNTTIAMATSTLCGQTPLT